MTRCQLGPGRASCGDPPGLGRGSAVTVAPEGTQACERRSRRRAQQEAEGREGHGNWGLLLAAGGCGEPQGGPGCGCSQTGEARALSSCPSSAHSAAAAAARPSELSPAPPAIC